MTSISVRRKGRKSFEPSARVVLSIYPSSPAPGSESPPCKEKTGARGFRAFRTVDSSPLRISAFRDSPLVPRTTVLRSVGVRMQMEPKRIVYRSSLTHHSPIGVSPSPDSLIEEKKHRSLLSSYLHKPKRRERASVCPAKHKDEDWLAPWGQVWSDSSALVDRYI